MVLEHDIPSFFVWLFGQRGEWGFLAAFVALVLALGIFAGFICFLIAAARYGPSEGLNIVARVFFAAFQEDLPRFSFRRMFAIAGLAVRESIRRKVLIVFVVFVILLLFAGLFLDVKNDHPARLYLSFVLTASNFLVLILALLLSTFSLPNDIKTRTIYTIVTKPVGAGEIVVGRIVGFSLVGTAILALMGLVSYFFVVRGLHHEHAWDAASLKDLPASEGGAAAGKRGKTSYDAHHAHDIIFAPDGTAIANPRAGHTHEITVNGKNPDGKIRIGPPIGMLEARVPILGEFHTTGRDGKEVTKGLNVGEEWGYRGYIEGGTAAELIWIFDGVTKERFPNGLPLEMNLRVFRTYKGNIEKGVYGDITIRNPNRKVSSDPMLFESKEFVVDSKLIPLKLKALPTAEGGAREIDLFEDLVSEGRVEVAIRCVERAQYFGAAKPDVYLRAADRPFFLNFIKGFLGVWFQMLIVTCFGVMFSTFLNGPVTFLATCSAIALGFFGEFVRKVLMGIGNEDDLNAIVGGGPIESLIRMVTQQSLTVDLEINSWVMQGIRLFDKGILGLLAGVTYLLPNFNDFSTIHFVAYGYDVNNDLLAEHAVLAFAFCLVTSIVGYFFLKTREIAA